MFKRHLKDIQKIYKTCSEDMQKTFRRHTKHIQIRTRPNHKRCQHSKISYTINYACIYFTKEQMINILSYWGKEVQKTYKRHSEDIQKNERLINILSC